MENVMRKSWWAVAAAGISSLVLLLTACGGSSSSSSSAPSTTGTSSSTPAAAGQPSSAVNLPSPGTQVLIVQKSNLGWVLAEANGNVVYTYKGDTKGGSPTCTGSCASIWPAVTGLPMAGPADTLPGTLGTIAMANGGKQITYNGLPLYTFKGAKALSTKGEGVGGQWHVIKLPASSVSTTG
jgi:predicted lipoprotein with Yx(FWY)xxD motif